MIDKIPMPVQVHETSREPQNGERIPWETKRLVLVRTEDGNLWFLEDRETAQEKTKESADSAAGNSSRKKAEESKDNAGAEKTEAKALSEDREKDMGSEETGTDLAAAGEEKDPVREETLPETTEEDLRDQDPESSQTAAKSEDLEEEDHSGSEEGSAAEETGDQSVLKEQDPVPLVTRPFVSGMPAGSVSRQPSFEETVAQDQEPDKSESAVAEKTPHPGIQPDAAAVQPEPDLSTVQTSVLQPETELLASSYASPGQAPGMTLTETMTRTNADIPVPESVQRLIPEKTAEEKTAPEVPDEERIQVRTGSHLFDWEPVSGLQVLKEAGETVPKLVTQDQPDCIQVRLDTPGQIVTALVDGEDTAVETDEAGDTFIRLEKGTNVRTVQALTDSGQLVEQQVATGKAFDWTSLWPATLLPLFWLKRLRHG